MILEAFAVIGAIISLYQIYFLSKREGFIEERVFDLLGSALLGYICLGKLFYIFLNPRIYGYYSVRLILLSGIDPFFGLIGALVAVLFYSRTLNKWSLNKVADILAKPVCLFGGFIFIGSFVQNQNPKDLFLATLWIATFLFFNFVEKKFLVGSSSKSFRVKRITYWAIPSFHFWAIALFLLALFFAENAFFTPSLWKIKSVLYVVVLSTTIALMVKVLKREDISDKVKEALLSQKKKIEKEEKNIAKSDPYFAKNRDIENSEEGDEVMDDLGHGEVDMQKGIYERLKRKIDQTLALINLGKYGKCEKCGGKIEDARLKANPYATTCVSCSSKNK
jgi:RNA polymerase-binding transcription factor DksA